MASARASCEARATAEKRTQSTSPHRHVALTGCTGSVPCCRWECRFDERPLYRKRMYVDPSFLLECRSSIRRASQSVVRKCSASAAFGRTVCVLRYSAAHGGIAGHPTQRQRAAWNRQRAAAVPARRHGPNGRPTALMQRTRRRGTAISSAAS